MLCRRPPAVIGRMGLCGVRRVYSCQHGCEEPKMIDSLFALLGTVSPAGVNQATDVLVNLLAALLLSVPLSLLYAVTHRHDGTKSTFLHTLVVLPLITAGISMVIGDNLVRAFGLIGAVALIRFRTVIKDTLDMAFVFLAITLGMACGTRLMPLGVAALGLFGATLGMMEATRYGKGTRSAQRFSVTVESDDIGSAGDEVRKHLQDIVVSTRLTGIERGGSGKLTYDMVLANGATERELVDRIIEMQGNPIKRIRIKKD
ncbi:MAG: DUF4956 domain-containing protein [Chitinivibrionales bacterium]|nr:DUF4956 domain-containing protein [Chitinivibrionales bacterium]